MNDLELQKEKSIEYANKIKDKLAQLFEEGDSLFIDVEELKDSYNFTAFIHALANYVPCSLFNVVSGKDLNNLEFNHQANLLCFHFSQVQKEEVVNNGNENQ